jgi:phosphomevalonate kinase
MQEEKK